MLKYINFCCERAAFGRRRFTAKDILFLYIFLFVCVIVAVFFSVGRLEGEVEERERITDIEIDPVDFSRSPDGVYYGECVMQAVAARVRVTVKDGRVVTCELLEHKTQRGSEADVIPSVVVSQQNLEVEAVTGATLSSKVILKAVERALSSAQRSCPYEAAAAPV